jgi:hypothetical protein
MVDVPVDDHDPLPPGDERRRGDRNVVEEAEPLAARTRGMVTRRAGDDERGLGVAAGQAIDGFEPAARGACGRRERRPRDDRIGIEVPTPVAREVFERADVARVVHPLELVARGVAPGTRDERLAEVRVVDTSERSGGARRALRMPATGVVRVGPGRRDQEDARGHVAQEVTGAVAWSELRRSMTRGTRRR